MNRSGLSLNVVVMGLSFVASGCTAQLSSNTVDMQAAYKELLVKQTLYNLGQAMDANFFPSQALIGSGSAMTTNTITPSVSIPFPTATVAATFGSSGAMPTLSNTSTNALGNAGLGVSFADSWQFTWALTIRTDPDELRRLRALYLYAVGGPLGSCLNDTNFTDEDKAKYTDVDAKYKACFKDQYVMQGTRTNVNQAFVQDPGCVLCGSAADQTLLHVNPKLLHGFVATEPRTGFNFFRRYGLTPFYLREPYGKEGFTDFMLFLLEAMGTSAFVQYKPPTEKGENQPETTRRVAPVPAPVPMPPKTQFPQLNNFSLPL